MKKLINKYNKECAIKSKYASCVWKIGTIINIIIYFINTIGLKKNYYFIFFLFTMIMLFIISQLLFVLEIGKKIGIKNNNISLEYTRNVYKKIDEFQNKWIRKYCKNNKINTVNKVELLIQEIENKREKNKIKYINPIIIGTLSITIWEIAIKNITDNIGFWNMLPIAVVSVLGISFTIGWISKEINEDRKIFNQFDAYCNKQRLEELLIEVALKCKK